MKLYEFSVNDNTNMTESELLESLIADMENEALVQGWAPGYQLRQCQKPVQLANGEMEYFFVVEGEVIGGLLPGDGQEVTRASVMRRKNAASSPEA